MGNERKFSHTTTVRKQITACLARAVERHRRARRDKGIMSWAEYQRLMAWFDSWEFYLRNERSKLYGKTSGTDSVPPTRR